MATPLDDFDRACSSFDTLVAGVSPDQWDLPTPCDEWNVRQLVNHVAGGTAFFITLMTHAAGPDRNADLLGENPAATLRELNAALRAEFGRPGVLETTYESPMGPQTGAGLAELRVTEYLAHGWDLMRATDQPSPLPNDLAEAAARRVAAIFAAMPTRPTGMFAPATTVADDAPAADRLAALLGRTPG